MVEMPIADFFAESPGNEEKFRDLEYQILMEVIKYFFTLMIYYLIILIRATIFDSFHVDSVRFHIINNAIINCVYFLYL